MPQGNYPVFDPRNPTLVPNTDLVQVVNGTVGLQSPTQLIANNPRVAATNAFTVAGSITNLDVITITFTCGALPGGVLAIPTTAITGDTVATLAEKISRQINDNAVLRATGVFSDVTAAGVVTVSWPGMVGNFCTLSKSVSGAATETITFAPVGGALTGGSGPIIPLQNFVFGNGTQTFTFWAYQPILLDYVTVQSMVTQGMAIS